MDSVFEVLETKVNVGVRAAQIMLTLAKQSAATFTIALSGGSFPKILAAGFNQLQKDKPELISNTNFNNWHIYLADERCVALGDDQSSFKANKQHFLNLDFVKVPENQMHPILANANEETNEKIMSDYEEKIRKTMPNGVFDLIFLGMGPDGHTASLFPGHSVLKRTGLLADVSDSPKPPPRRITLTLETINKAKNVIFVVTGASKAPVVDEIRRSFQEKTESKYPAGMIRVEALKWLLDGPAGEVQKAEL